MSSGRRSPPHHAGNQSRATIEPFYTNEDVALLHDIVVLAQEFLPDLPERERLPTNALFSAYDDILPRTGVNADHDSRYARFLFRIGGLRSEGTLYEKFEEILSRMGIEIEFDAEEYDSDDEHKDAPAAVEDADVYDKLQDDSIQQRRSRRRNSDSVWDLGVETPANSKSQRRNSYSSVNKVSVPPTSYRQGFPREALQQQASHQLPGEARELRGSNVGAWLSTNPEPALRERGRSISTHGGMRIRRQSFSAATGHHPPTTFTSNPNSDEYHAESEITAVTSAVDADIPKPINLPQRHHSSKPSAGLMQRKAEVILQHHLNLLAKLQIRTWRDKALQRGQDNVNLELMAVRHDMNALLYQALETWHSRYIEKRSIAETERFFAHLERRAVFARNNYLKLKVLTHWHVTASEGAERTRAARRHILRTRIFNAWRDITAVNELKVRRHVLKKFFSVWQGKLMASRNIETTALQRYDDNVVEKIFKQWAWKMWGIKANKWWADGVKRRTLSYLNVTTQNCLEHHRTAVKERRLQLTWNAWQMWRAKTNEHIKQVQQAVTFNQAYVCLSAIRKWRGETKVIPVRKTLQTEVAVRILRGAFEIWLHRSRQQSQAAAVDRMHIRREAWTNWRHKSRLQMMHFHVNQRIIWKIFVKWMLERKASTTKRSLNGKLLHNTLQHWAKRARESQYRRLNQEDLAQQYAANMAQHLVMRHWSARSHYQQQLAADAQDLHASRLLQGSLLKWSEKLPHLQQLQQWSRDAEFYFLTSKALRRWKVSTESSKREKRKAAYAQIRRTTKMSLGRAMLLGWRSKAQKILEMQAQVDEMTRNKDVILGMNIFDCWRARTDELGEMEAIWREKVFRKFFDIWRDRSMAFQDLNIEAIINFQERQSSRAIKKWTLVVLQMRGRSIQAAEVQEKNAKRTFRRMFNYWIQKATERRPVKLFVASEQGERTQLGAITRTEAWSDFEGDIDAGGWAKGLDDPIASTAIPGYLSTPSRKTERVVAAAARFSSTTPRAPLSTPFERHLRAQYSGGMLPSARKGPKRSALGMGGGFPDIADASTNDSRGNP